MSMMFFFPVVNFWVNSRGCPGELYAVFGHFEDLRNLILDILK